MTTICCDEWSAPRVDVRDSAPVRHVCALGQGHKVECRCSCGAWRDGSARLNATPETLDALREVVDRTIVDLKSGWTE